ncbi:hypothetical protein ACTXT7_005082 [Hymenolepis weldensis]
MVRLFLPGKSTDFHSSLFPIDIISPPVLLSYTTEAGRLAPNEGSGQNWLSRTRIVCYLSTQRKRSGHYSPLLLSALYGIPFVSRSISQLRPRGNKLTNEGLA